MKIVQGRRPTQRDIALTSGMSQAAVSLVLNRVEPCTVSEAARKRILEIADHLGYVPNRVAQSLKSTRTRTLACVVPDITNPTYPSLVRGFQSVADGAGYDVMIYDTDGTRERELRALQWLLQGHVDGVLAAFFHLSEAEILPLVKRGVALVQVESQAHRASKHIDKVYVDNAAAAQAMTAELIARGHSRVALLSCAIGPGHERQRGYRAAMQLARLPICEISADEFTQAAGERCMAQFLRGRHDCTAVFAANDLLAIGAMTALHAQGLRIPQDMAVAGFDDIPSAQLLHPPLSTVHRSEQAMGRFAAERLLLQLNDGPRPAGSFELPYKVVLRGSV